MVISSSFFFIKHRFQFYRKLTPNC
uniref:Uncharacterized protein n=1 Tax=Rhizophora mucronata TaxID=61149 RepID=A0A2P2PZ73_RHIMU